MLETGHITTEAAPAAARRIERLVLLPRARRLNGERRRSAPSWIDAPARGGAGASRSEHRLAEQSRTLTALTGRSAGRRRRLTGGCAIFRASPPRRQAEPSASGGWTPAAAIQCVSLFKNVGQHETGARIERADCAVLRRSRRNASSPPTMRIAIIGRSAFAWLLVPNGIGAMLDVPLRQHGTLGVLARARGRARWALDEQNFRVVGRQSDCRRAGR